MFVIKSKTEIYDFPRLLLYVRRLAFLRNVEMSTQMSYCPFKPIHTQRNGAVSNVNKRLVSHPTLAQRTLLAAGTVKVSHALPALHFSCLLRCHRTSFQDGVAAGEGSLCALFWGVQICFTVARASNNFHTIIFGMPNSLLALGNDLRRLRWNASHMQLTRPPAFTQASSFHQLSVPWLHYSCVVHLKKVQTVHEIHAAL
jgi:hypothetical protein